MPDIPFKEEGYWPSWWTEEDIRAAELDGAMVRATEYARVLVKKSGHPEFFSILSELSAMHEKKNQDYGTATDPFANVRASANWGVPAWVGAMVRANDKVVRLQAAAQGSKLVNEGVEDSLLDLASYAVIALVLYREQSSED